MQFAICITFPGTDSTDIVTAAIENQVHILDKEEYDRDKDYEGLFSQYKIVLPEQQIFILLVFHKSDAVLITDVKAANEIISKEVMLRYAQLYPN